MTLVDVVNTFVVEYDGVTLKLIVNGSEASTAQTGDMLWDNVIYLARDKGNIQYQNGEYLQLSVSPL